MPYPDDYPERFKNSIFQHQPGEDFGPGSLAFVFTRAGGRLKVYVLQYLGHAEDAGDVYLAADHGEVHDKHYNPEAEGSMVYEDMHWANDRPRLSQPVRRWLESRDMALANRENLLDLVATNGRFDLSRHRR